MTAMYPHYYIKKITCTVFFSCFIATLVSSQQGNLRFTHYTTREGLSNDHVFSIFQDTRGLLWIGTSNGLNIFDGNSFEKIYPTDFDSANLHSDVVTHISEDPNENILFVTADGLEMYEWKKKNIRLILPSSDSNSVWDVIKDHQENIWVLTKTALEQFNAHFKLLNTWQLPISNTKYSSALNNFFTVDNENNIWFNFQYTTHELIAATHVIDNKFHNPDHCKIFDLTVDWIEQDKQGNYWITNDSLMCYHPGDNTFSVFHYHKRDQLTELKITHSGNFFIASFHRGVLSFNPMLKIFQSAVHNPFDESSPSDNFVSTIFEDVDGNIWLGTNSGLDKWDIQLNEFRVFDNFGYDIAESGNRSNISGILILSGKIFVSTTHGFFNIDEKNFSQQHFRFDEKNYSDKDNYWTGIRLNKKSLLASTWKGLLLYNVNNKGLHPSVFKIPHPSLLDSVPVVSMFEDNHHNIWFGLFAEYGIIFWNRNNNEFTKYSLSETGKNYFPLRHFTCAIEDDSGNIWMGYDKGGLAIYNVTKQKFIQPSSPSFNELNGNVIHDIINDHHGNLWISTSEGLFCYSVARDTFQRFTRKEGMISNIVFGLAIDHNNNLWLGQFGGLCKLNLPTKHFTNFEMEDGLPEENVEKVFFDSTSNRIYFSTDHTVVYFDADRLKKYLSLLKPVITSFKVFEKERNLGDTDSLNLSYKENFFSFNYTAPNFLNPNDTRYSYKMEGFDKKWINAGSRQYAAYTNLSGGVYTFKLKATTDGIHWYEMNTHVAIHISIAFYKTTWFIILFALTIFTVTAFVIYFVHRVKLQKVLMTQKIRNNIAGDLHDDIGSSLSSIMLMSEVAKKLPSQTADYLTQISETARKIIENMNDIVWAVNPDNDAMEQIIIRMQQFASSLLEKKNIALRFEACDEIKKLKLGMQERKNFYLIFKETIHNAVKYSECSLVIVKISADERSINMKIEDNGKGFDTSKKYIGNGINNLQKRAKEIKGIVEIFSAPDKGTTTQLTFTTYPNG